jgi:hypothetical protein
MAQMDKLRTAAEYFGKNDRTIEKQQIVNKKLKIFKYKN